MFTISLIKKFSRDIGLFYTNISHFSYIFALENGVKAIFYFNLPKASLMRLIASTMFSSLVA